MKQALSCICCAFLLATLPVHSWSQANSGGIPLITNYDFRVTGGSEQNWALTQDHRGILYVGNNDAGVLEYDGVSWQSIPIPGHPIVRSLATGENGEVYVGTADGFGVLMPGPSGEMTFQSLSDSIGDSEQMFSDEWKIYSHGEKIYFCTYPNVYIYHSDNHDIEIVALPLDAYFSFLIDGELYTSDYGQGLMKLQGDHFEPVPGGNAFKEKSITAMIRSGDTKLLIGTYWSGIFRYDTGSGTVDSTFLSPELNDYLCSSAISTMQYCQDQLVVATLFNGLLVLNHDFLLVESITRKEGLMDETITSLYAKDGGPLWLTTFMGVSKIEINSPLRVSTEKQGFEGFITDIQSFEGRLFISSYGGLYQRKESRFGTEYTAVEGVDPPIYDLLLFSPSEDEQFLLASGPRTLYRIDRELRVQDIPEYIDNLSSDPLKQEDYGGFRILRDPRQQNVIYTGSEDVVGLQYDQGRWKERMRVGLPEDKIREMEFDSTGSIWISTYRSVFRVDAGNALFYSASEYGVEKGLPEDYENTVFLDPGTGEILIGSMDGFLVYDADLDSLVREERHNSILPEGSNYIHAFYRDHDGDYWYSVENESSGWYELIARWEKGQMQILRQRPFRRLENVSTDVFYSDPENGYWFGKSRELYSFRKSVADQEPSVYHTLLRRAIINEDSVLFDVSDRFSGKRDRLTPEVRHADGNLEFLWASPFFIQEEAIRYSYLLEGFNDDWSDYSRETGHYYTNLPPGKYSFRVRARNVFGDESTMASFSFRILPPWYLHVLAIMVYLVFLVLIIIAIVRFFTHRLQRRAAELEYQNIKIENQRKELEDQNRKIQKQKEQLETLNEELSSKHHEIEAQRDSIMAQKDLIESQKTAITDSIHYARRIQDAVLPSEEVVRYLLPKHFVFYRPQQIVSGDFFWLDKKEEKVLLALGDCTGHGVPGAFMSILGISLLNEISGKLSGHPTNELMDELRDRLMVSLRQTGSRMETWDGMDMGMVCLDPDSRKLQFTGAHHNLYIYRKGKLEVIKGDRMPVGIHTKAGKLFSAHELQLNRGDCFYLSSDGLPDQFGGDEGKKYGYTRFKTFLESIQDMILIDQLNALEKEFDRWKGKEEQVDDVLVIGIKV